VLPAPVQRPIPVWVGGKGGPRLLRLAARHAAGWNVVWRMSPEAYDEKLQDVRRACDAVGRDASTFRLSVGLHALLGEDDASARAAFERGKAAMPGDALAAETYETWCADTLSGTPAQVRERAAAFEARGGADLPGRRWVRVYRIYP